MALSNFRLLINSTPIHFLDGSVDRVHSVLLVSFGTGAFLGVINAESFEALVLLRRGYALVAISLCVFGHNVIFSREYEKWEGIRLELDDVVH